ncbi:MAG: hypothetical protein DMF64_02850 [Acidobacteria bacterium]|nr:MAG: hypothetical protein DMF64_02850 [Acidobacteriota bacterium]
MPAQSLARLLERLEELQRDSGAQVRAQLQSVLRQLARRRFPDAASLIRFHESLLFLRAYPPSATLLRQIEKMLATFKQRVDELRAQGAADFETFSESDVSGIVGTDFTAAFSYDITRWLARAHPRQVKLVWDRFDQLARITATFPRFLPLFAESAYVDASVPFPRWLRAAKKKGETELAWLLRQFEQLPLTDKEQAELFEPIQFWVRWELGDTKATRTHMRLSAREIFYQRTPLLGRRDVSLEREFAAPPLPIVKLSRTEGERLLAQGRDTMAVRFRELHGFTYGDPETVWRAQAGRGLVIYVWGVPAARRLPTLAYHAMFLSKNGVPCGYAEGLSLFERTEIGVNIFYTFRAGESAWLYARLMRLFHQLLGTSVFSIDPYQLGAGNEEGIESGAYWFYRKLGFRPTDTELVKLDARESHKIATRAGYRTSANTLRRLATGHVLYEAPDAERGTWDRFHVHHIGLKIARRMGRKFGGDSDKIGRASVATVARALDVRLDSWRADEQRAFDDLALVLALIPDLVRWSVAERRALVQVIRAKASADELDYLRRLQRHKRLRRAIIELGTQTRTDEHAGRDES